MPGNVLQVSSQTISPVSQFVEAAVLAQDEES